MCVSPRVTLLRGIEWASVGRSHGCESGVDSRMNARCFCGSGFARGARWMAPATVALVVALLAAAGPVNAATAFSDGFESGDYSAWSQVQTGGNGMAVVQSAIRRSGGLAAELSESSTAGSRAYAGKTFASAQQDLTAGGDFRVIGQGAS